MDHRRQQQSSHKSDIERKFFPGQRGICEQSVLGLLENFRQFLTGRPEQRIDFFLTDAATLIYPLNITFTFTINPTLSTIISV